MVLESTDGYVADNIWVQNLNPGEHTHIHCQYQSIMLVDKDPIHVDDVFRH